MHSVERGDNMRAMPTSRAVTSKPAAPDIQAAPAKRPELGLAHAISERLQQLIYGGEIAPGERLNEAALSTRMGTSRGPIREAIRMLTGIGLVVAVPNRGVFVRQISVREMLEIYELRAMLSGAAAQHAAEHLSAADRREFEQLLAGMDAACDAGDGQRYYLLNLRFHALLVAQWPNQRAQQAYEDYAKQLHLYRRRYFNATINMRRSNNEHRGIFDAIAAGNKQLANKLAQAHVLHGRQRLLSTLELPATAPAPAASRPRRRA